MEAGSKRILGPLTCGVAGETAAGADIGGCAPGFAADAGATPPEGVKEGEGLEVGALTSSSFLTAGMVSVPEYSARRFDLVHSGMRTMRGVRTISTSLSWMSVFSAENR